MRASSAAKGTPAVPSDTQPPSFKVPEQVTFYHWLVVLLASCGWMFDCMGQRIFVLSREPAMRELLGAAASDAAVRRWGGLATLLLMVGWATGGILFGTLSDRYGRVKTMLATLGSYTLFSGLSGFAHSGLEFLLWRFLFGLGVGGMFGSATTLVAESVPTRVRTAALGTMQALSAVGNIVASALSLAISPGQENFWNHYSGWRVLSFAGVLPLLLAIPIVLLLKEPEVWRRAKSAAAQAGTGKAVGSLREFFAEKRWRHNLLIGVCLGVAGMVGLWGIAFFSPELISTALKNRPLNVNEVIKPAELCVALNAPTNHAIAGIRGRLTPEMILELEQVPAGQPPSAVTLRHLVQEMNGIISHGAIYDARTFSSVLLTTATRSLAERVARGERQDTAELNRQLLEETFPGMIAELQRSIDYTRSRGTLLQDVGALAGMLAFTLAAAYFNRRTAFLGAFVLCMVSVAYVFHSLKTAGDVTWMLPLVGFATLSVFAGYSIYFPELFPTRLRGTGIGFCYNTVRYLAAPFPFLLGWLSARMPFRTVAVIMCGIYLVGIVALIWAPETKGQPLPEDG